MAPSPLHRYHRQMMLPGFGEQGQRALLRSRVLLVGCGALGTVAAELLVRAGVGKIIIADRDFVEQTNLQRQVLFDEHDAAQSLPKAEAARAKLGAINSSVTIEAIVDDVNETNMQRLASDCDVIVDGTDNYETRFLINDAAVKLGVPYVYGGAVGTAGTQYTVLPRTASASGGGDSAWERAGRATPCLRCVFDRPPPPGATPTCETAGVFSPTVGIIASYEVAAALKVLTKQWDQLTADFLQIDPWQNTTRRINVAPADDANDCVCCKQRQFDYLAGEHMSRSATLCGRDAVQLRPNGSATQLDLATLADRLRAHGEVTTNSYMLRAAITEGDAGYELSVFTDGRAIIKGTQDPSLARSLYARYIGA